MNLSEALDKLQALFNSDDIKETFDNEETVLLLCPDETFVNRALEAVGLAPDYVMNTENNPSGYLEMFAIAKRDTDVRTHTFRYEASLPNTAVISDDSENTVTEPIPVTITSDDTYIYVWSGDECISSLDISAKSTEPPITSTEDDDNVMDDELFSVDRWRSFYEWCAGLTDWAEEQDAQALSIESRISAANDDLTKIANAQGHTLDFSINQSNFTPPAYAKGAWQQMGVDIKRKNIISFTVYNCHSFKYHDDYYLVQARATTVPLNYQKKMPHKIKWGSGSTNTVCYLSGYTGSFGFESYVDINNGNLTLDQIAIDRHQPINVAKSKTYTSSESWNISGNIGVNTTTGLTLGLTPGASYTSGQSWTTTDFSIIDKTSVNGNTKPEWTLDVTGPSVTDWHWETLLIESYYELTPTAASTQALNFNSEWIWRVNKSIWSRGDLPEFDFNGKRIRKLPMKIICKTQEGFCFGKGEEEHLFSHFVWGEQRTYPLFTKTQTMNLDMPPHCWLSQSTFSFSKAANHGDFTLLSEENWTLSTSASWVHLSVTNGSGTNDEQKQVLFDVDANNTGAIRTATIEFTCDLGNNRTETATIQINQSAN